MVMGSWHRNEQNRIMRLLFHMGYDFYNDHGESSGGNHPQVFGYKYRPDFFILYPFGGTREWHVLIELFSAARVMDERNAIRIRYWCKKGYQLIIITEGGIIEALKSWLWFSGYFYDSYYIHSHMLQYHLENEFPF